MDEEHTNESTKPGQYLAYEREKKGFTIEDISGKLRLSPHIIRALEEEMHDKLPELVYVRGYIRAYCRLLRIDPVPVLDMYTANLPQETDNFLEDLSSNSPINERQQKYIIFFGSVAVISIFLALVIGWWQENRLVAIPLSEPLVSQEDTAPASVGEPLVSQEDTVPASVSEPSVSQGDTAPAFVSEPSLSQEDTAGQSEPSDIPPQQEVTPPSSDIETINIPNDDIRPAVLDTNADTEASDEQFDATDDMPEPITLVVMSNGESWARVTDGSGDIFIHRILPAGYNKIFMVNLPLKFELGNAPQMSVMIDGKDYDLSSYIRPNNVAFFEVSELP